MAFPAFIALVVVLIVYGAAAAKKRRAELEETAQRMGWSFRADREHDFKDRFPQFAAFRSGSDRYAYNLLSGPLQLRGVNCHGIVGEYHYETESGTGDDRKTTSHYFSFLLVCLPWRDVGDLAIRREGFFDRVAGMLGWEDIDFEWAEFSRNFHVKSSNKRFAYDVIDQRMMEFLMADFPGPVWIDRDWLMVYTGGVWKPQEIGRFIAWAARFLEQWPRHVDRALGGHLPVAPRPAEVVEQPSGRPMPPPLPGDRPAWPSEGRP